MALAGTGSGLPAALAAYGGRPIYLDFWASWCGPCAESFPWLNAMQAKYGGRLTVVAVDVDSDATASHAFLVRHPASFPVVSDPDGKLAQYFNIQGMPAAVIIDGAGRIRHEHAGFWQSSTATYEAAIQTVLNTAGTAGSHAP